MAFLFSSGDFGQPVQSSSENGSGITKDVNDQITMELQVTVVYRQLAIEMDVTSLPGFAQWFRAQAAEEITHAERFIDHMVDRGGNLRSGASGAQ